jgi:hypothetical protein
MTSLFLSGSLWYDKKNPENIRSRGHYEKMATKIPLDSIDCHDFHRQRVGVVRL